VAYEGGDLERVREERDNSIRELRARGLSIRKIASLLDCKKSQEEHGIRRHSRITRLSGVHACELSQHCCAEGLNGPWR
jgi:DNA-binding transcriptional MerR regulator